MPISALEPRPKLYLAISYPLASVETISRVLPDHLRYMTEHEDKIFLAGPFIGSGGEGMTIFLCHSAEEATRMMQSDPFVVQGVRRFEIKAWELHFGIPVAAGLSPH